MKWQTALVPGYAPNGAPILSVLGKQTYTIKSGEIAKFDTSEQIPFFESDEFLGDGNPISNAVKHEVDKVAYKPMTDFVVHGNAHCPRGKKAFNLDVSIQIENVKKIIRVIGDRNVFVTSHGISFTDPKPFEKMPLHYELAYGGIDSHSHEGTDLVYPRNPLGKGFVVKNTAARLQNLALPNLEDPAKLLTPGNLILGSYEKWFQYPDPLSFGYTSKNFHPRYTLSGMPMNSLFESEEIRQRHIHQMNEVGSGSGTKAPPTNPLLNLQFYNGASKGLMFPWLKGNENITLIYMDPDCPKFSFQLPGIMPKAWIDVGEGPEAMSMVPQNIEVFKETNQVSLVWRGSVYYEGAEAMEEFESLDFGVES